MIWFVFIAGALAFVGSVFVKEGFKDSNRAKRESTRWQWLGTFADEDPDGSKLLDMLKQMHSESAEIMRESARLDFVVSVLCYLGAVAMVVIAIFVAIH